MPHFVTPNSHGTLREFNTCHTPGGSTVGGQFCSGKGSVRGTPTRATSLDHAIELLMAGRKVQLGRTQQVNTLLHRLASMALDAKNKGEKAPHYDLCNVTVPGAKNVFCGSMLRTAEHPNGVPRIAMPQFGGEFRPGSLASKLPKDHNGGVDGAQAFISHLKTLGIRTSEGSMPAARLKASQSELVGAKVAKMMTKTGYNPGAKPIFVSRDGYVIDGHHRWAAVVGRDAADGKLGGLRIKVIRVSAPIREILKIANRWTKDFGIVSKENKEARAFSSRHRIWA